MKKETKYIDISPHRSILTKIAQTGYSVQEALSELIDNSIDARVGEGMQTVSVDITQDEVVIKDSGKGIAKKKLPTRFGSVSPRRKNNLVNLGLALKPQPHFWVILSCWLQLKKVAMKSTFWNMMKVIGLNTVIGISIHLL